MKIKLRRTVGTPLYQLLLAIFLSLGTQVMQAQVADFTPDNTSGCAPLVAVNFINNSSGGAVSYLWDFGNGNTSTLASPGAFYTVPGTYVVRLTVDFGGGLSDTHTDTVVVFAGPTVDFGINPNFGCVPHSVNFTDLSVAGDTAIVDWIWDFGDGTTSSLQNPSHTYNSIGSYDVTLVATDGNGCRTTFIKNDSVDVSTPPTIDFSASNTQSCNAPLTTRFTSSVSPTGTYTYLWDFGDGNTSTAPNPGHAYSTTGNYSVTLTVTDQNGCAETESKFDFIQIGRPVADYNVSNSIACAGQPVNFINLSTGADSYSWDFGDGGTSTNSNPIHSYAAPGTYNVRLLAQNTVDGCSDVIVKTNIVEVRPSPLVNFSATNNIGCQVPQSVTFTDASTNAATYLWDFGDGNTASAPSPVTHVYTAQGIYDVTLTVTSVDGCQTTRTIPSLVQIVPPTANFAADSVAGCIPLDVDFQDLSISNDPITLWTWTFGDGTGSTVQNPRKTYTSVGTFDVTLTIRTASGCIASITQADYIQAGTRPIVDFTANPVAVCVDDLVTFNNMTNVGNIWQWFFGDGNGSNAQFPTHAYQDTGTFDVTLIANHFGCFDTLIREEYIRVFGPIADFELAPQRGCDVPLTVTFTDASIDPTGWVWDFGDGNTDTVQNPVHTYTSPGTYTVRLTVVNDSSGCTDVFEQDITISKPTASFTVGNTFGCNGITVPITNESLNATNYTWDFGDGGTSTAANPSYTYNTPGTYRITLIAEDNFGCRDTFENPVNINIIGTDVIFDADTTFGCAPLSVTFSNASRSYPSTNSIIAYFWDFGDGGTSGAANPVYTYSTPGVYDVRLTVIDDQGCVSTLTRPSYINPTFPTAQFTTSDTLACPGALVSFNDQSIGNGLNYFWDFGDGNSSIVVNPQNLYPGNGSYTVTLTVIDANGCSDSEVKFNHINISKPTAAFANTSVRKACPPLQVTFTDQSSSDVVSWLWDFGDGSTSTLPNPSKVYGIAGNYSVRLIVENTEGCRDTILKSGLVELDGPAGSFTMGPLSGCNPLTVNFSASTAGAVSWQWDFGDGSLGTGATTSHTYTRDTIAYPILSIRDTAGCLVTVQSPDSIDVKPLPIPSFTTNFTDICLGQRVFFTNTSSSADPIVLYEWDFGDGTTSNVRNPDHTYTTVGNYDVSLALQTSEGCRDTVTTPITITVKGPPTAFFTPSRTRGCVPLTNVVFRDSSFGSFPIVDWRWDFGDGGIDSAQFPVYTFNNSGIYNVSLIVTDIEGCSDTMFQVITVDALPNMDFTVSDRFSCAPDQLRFTDQTSSSASITNWFWQFGDGATSTQQNPVHTYAIDGNYTVSLQVTDANGCSNSLTRNSYIVLRHPVADFVSTAVPSCPGQRVRFTNTSTPDTTLNFYFWQFGDGGTSRGQNPRRTYNNPGTYDVTFVVGNILGCRDTITKPAHVTIYTPPTASMVVSKTAFCTPDSIRVISTSTNGTSPITSTFWEFGNGNVANTQVANFTYTISGNYTLRLTVTDSLGCEDRETQTINAYPVPEVDFVADDTLNCAPINITFTDQTTSSATLTNWLWDFGDGTFGAGNRPINRYNTNGVYDVSLIATDINGCRDTLIKPQYIVLDHPTANFSIVDTLACTLEDIQFYDLSAGNLPITGWDWDFGDGNTSNVQNPVHRYSAPGTYTVRLVASDSKGCTDAITRTTLVRILPSPIIGFSVSDNADCTPFGVGFTDASAPNGSPIVSRLWEFGDGNSSTSVNPFHTYTTPGIYSARLTLTDLNGCTSRDSVSLTSYTRPIANFSSADSLGCLTQTVTFTDSTVSPYLLSSWSWNFGDGNTDTVQSPVHSYSGLGPYTVRLEVEDQFGCRDTIIKTNFVSLFDPQVDFTLSRTQGCPGVSVTFTGSASVDTSVANWFWDFGDGQIGFGQTTSHTYNNPGQYTVGLVIQTVVGCIARQSKVNVIQVFEAPNAGFEAIPPAGCTPFATQFQDTSSTGSAAITQWFWDFDNGSTSTAQNPAQLYGTAGAYDVFLRIIDNNGCRDSITQVTDAYDLPTANFFSNDTMGCAPQVVRFFDLSTGPAAAARWLWDFGDGNTDTVQNPVHTYANEGNYDVQLIMWDANGCSDTILFTDYIRLSIPDADFTMDQRNGCPGTTVEFTDQSVPDFPLVIWAWDFGDGNTSSLQNPQHVFGAAGTYTVTLTVTNVNGCTSTYQDSVLIYAPPTADFSPDAAAGCAPFLARFNDGSIANQSGASLVSWNWTFGDGNTSTARNPGNTYLTPGVYNVQLIVADNLGCQDTSSSTVEAFGLPTANFTASDTFSCSPIAIQFTDGSTGPNTITGWQWNFGDAGTDTVQNPSHLYTADGTYDVTLTVTDTNGCQSVLTRLAYVRLSRPDANFTLSDSLGCPLTTVTFVDASIADTTLVGWQWSFGDGGTDTVRNPSHQYTTPGLYDVTLITTNIIGCQDTFTMQRAVRILDRPGANFTMSAPSGCIPFNLQFFNNSTLASSPIISYNWDLGNGQTSNQTNPSTSYTSAGIYTVRLIVTDANGCRDTISRTVEAFGLPTADFMSVDTFGCAPTVIPFIDQSIGATAWEWSFGNGSTSNQRFPSVLYTQNGVYDVSLKIWDINGCQDSVLKPNYIRLTQPTASFSVDKIQDCPGLTFNFTDLSVPDHPLTSWSWNFGDGNTSTLQNPSHAYQVAGTYSVTLIVTNVLGCSDTLTRTNLVTVPNPPQAAIIPTTLSGCTPFSTSLSDGSIAGSSPLTGRVWTFGNGNSSTAANPNVIYTTPGVYTVQLIVTDALGCLDTATQQLEAFALPNAQFSASDTIGCSPIAITFSELSAGPAPVTQWTWNFGDGNSSTLSSPTHIYTNDGSYTVSLTVEDANGCRDSLTKPSYINLTRPAADFTLTPAQTCPGTTLSFTDATTPDYPLVSWEWDFGDGTSSTLQNPTHFYGAGGVYTVRLIVTNVQGCRDTVTKPAVVQIYTPPTAGISLSDNDGCTPFGIAITDVSVAGSAPVTNWQWDFGDGTTSTAQNPGHTYTTPGTYTISLITTDGNGCRDTVSQSVTSYQLPTADMFTVDTSGCAPRTVSFSDLSSGPATLANWNWSFGDGNTSTAQNPVHTYVNVGNYTVQLEVVDVNGCADTLIRPNYIQLSNPTADFVVSDSQSCRGNTVQFTDTSIPDAPLVSWQWDFGDGNTSTAQNPVHTYTTQGTYTVELVVTNMNGCTDTVRKPSIIQVLTGPEAVFSLSSRVGCIPFALTANDRSVAYDGALNDWQWTWGDGQTTSGANSGYTYTTPGRYTIGLTVTDVNGCVDTVSQVVEARGLPTAEFVSLDTIGCGPQATTFSDQSTGPATINQWFWNFGDGNTSNSRNPINTYLNDGVYDVELIVSDVNGCR
ncbi:MAG: PKD domain-containing protein, partial [Bacteroidota bacterium]